MTELNKDFFTNAIYNGEGLSSVEWLLKHLPEDINLFKFDNFLAFMPKAIQVDITRKAIATFDVVKALINVEDFHFFPNWDKEKNLLKVELCISYGRQVRGELYFYVDGLDIRYEEVEVEVDTDYYGDTAVVEIFSQKGEIKVLD